MRTKGTNGTIKLARLGDVCRVEPGQPSVVGEKIWWLTLDQVEQQTGRVIEHVYASPSEIGSSTVLFDEENVLYSKLRPNLNKVVLPDSPGIATSEMLPLKVTDQGLYRDYLAWYLRSTTFVSWAVSKVAGAKMPRLGTKTLMEAEIPLPPLAEQKRIAEELDNICAAKKDAEAIVEKLKLLAKSLFVEMFGDMSAEMKFPAVPIGDLCEVKSGGTPDRKKAEYWQNGTIPWVKTTELQNSVINDTQEKITDVGMQCSSAKFVPAETVLIAMYGQGKTRGMTGFLNISATTNQSCACLLPGHKVNQKYLWRCLIQSYDRLRNLAQGAGQPNLSGKMIKEFAVPLPPRELQDQYVAFIEQLDKSQFEAQALIGKLDLLYRAKLQEYFG